MIPGLTARTIWRHFTQRLWMIAYAAITPVVATQELAQAPKPLTMTDVLESVVQTYPPYLAAVIERDIAAGIYRSALGAMDLQTYWRLFQNPTGFYQSTTAEAGFEQFTNLRGTTFFGGYRYTDGTLPDYYRSRRTNRGGTPSIGLRIPLLRDGNIDARRASIYRANIEQELANPVIRQQHLDMTLASMRVYFHWLATGRKFAFTKGLLAIAEQRKEALETQIAKGLTPPVANLENRQLVASRRLAVNQAQRELEAASIALSLFLRDHENEPIMTSQDRLPEAFPKAQLLPPTLLGEALKKASAQRPELRILELELQKLNIDQRLFRNQLQPHLNAFVSASRSLGDALYQDTGELELDIGIEFKMPLQRNSAKGKLESNAGKIEQLEHQTEFALNRITAEVWDAHSALQASWNQLHQANENVDLANQLQEVEQDRFTLGATDFLSLQLREQAAFQAKLLQADVQKRYFTALASLIVASGIDGQTILDNPNIDLLQMILNPDSR